MENDGDDPEPQAPDENAGSSHHVWYGERLHDWQLRHGVKLWDAEEEGKAGDAQ